ncbi:MAG: hypothetical protein OXB91_01075, partial [Bryobacterales bacterium]|nr:hypothetical protein [Bryobacterales bacterium]
MQLTIRIAPSIGRALGLAIGLATLSGLALAGAGLSGESGDSATPAAAAELRAEAAPETEQALPAEEAAGNRERTELNLLGE